VVVPGLHVGRRETGGEVARDGRGRRVRRGRRCGREGDALVAAAVARPLLELRARGGDRAGDVEAETTVHGVQLVLAAALGYRLPLLIAAAAAGPLDDRGAAHCAGA